MKKLQHHLKRGILPILCLSLLLSSCGLIEMRDSYEDTTQGEGDVDRKLAPAERVNDVEIRVEQPEGEENAPAPASFPMTYIAEVPKTVVHLVAAGDVRIDDHIIADAANRAGEGSTYSFLKIYSGVYREIHDADIALGGYSTANAPYQAEDKDQTTPVESLASLSELGFDVLNTGAAEADTEEYDIGDLCESGGYYTVEADGISVSFVAANGSGPRSEKLEVVEDAKESSDVVVVSVNWGADTGDKQKRDFSQEMADAGADLIVGTGGSLGGAEWFTAEDGTETLTIYSLGNFVATGETPAEVCGGIFSVDLVLSDGEVTLESPQVEPIITHYGADYHGYQIFPLAGYSADIAKTHGLEKLDLAALTKRIRANLGQFLPEDIRG